MLRQVQPCAGGRLPRMVRWLQLRIENSCRCRECEAVVGAMADICPRCGSANPVRLPVSTAALVVSLVCTGIIFLLRSL